MTPDISVLEARLVAAIEKAKASGKRIVAGIWGVYRNYEETWTASGDCCCVFGAVLLAENPAQSVYKTTALMQCLGIEAGVIAGVMGGFDGYPAAEYKGDYPDAFALGQRLHQRFVEADL